MTVERESLRVLRKEPGTKRILAVSDVHGERGLLDGLLKKLDYRPEEDALVVVGDVVQRGRENLAALRRVMELAKLENVFVLLGNNDDFLEHGRDEKVFEHTSFFRERSLLGDMLLHAGLELPKSVEETCLLRRKAEELYPEEHRFLRERPHILETERFLFAHAGLQGEAPEEEDRDFVLATASFHETAEHVFSKLLVVGHWPAANYHRDVLSCAPVYNERHNILSIDGGNVVQRVGQLVGVILDNETGNWSWTSVNGFPKIKAPCSQEARPGTLVTWPENYVELLERGEAFSRCRVKKDGTVLVIPNEFLFKDGEKLRTDTITGALLSVERGEEVGVVKDLGDRLLIVKNGEAGFLLLK